MTYPWYVSAPLLNGTSALGYPLKNVSSTSDVADAIFTRGS